FIRNGRPARSSARTAVSASRFRSRSSRPTTAPSVPRTAATRRAVSSAPASWCSCRRRDGWIASENAPSASDGHAARLPKALTACQPWTPKPPMVLVHGTTVALQGEGVLLRGPSGSGKSDLALRLIDGGARLVADDQTEIERTPNGLMACSPATIAGKIE